MNPIIEKSKKYNSVTKVTSFSNPEHGTSKVDFEAFLSSPNIVKYLELTKN